MGADLVEVVHAPGGWVLLVRDFPIAHHPGRDAAERAADVVRGALAAEREACARVAEAHAARARRDADRTGRLPGSESTGAYDRGRCYGAAAVARGIRARADGGSEVAR